MICNDNLAVLVQNVGFLIVEQSDNLLPAVFDNVSTVAMLLATKNVPDALGTRGEWLGRH